MTNEVIVLIEIIRAIADNDEPNEPNEPEGSFQRIKRLADQILALLQKQPPKRKIRVLKNVRSGIPGREHISITKGRLYDAEVNKHGAVSACTEYGLLGVKSDEYEFVCEQPPVREFDVKKFLCDGIESHKSWLAYLTKHPDEQIKYAETAGDIKHQKECLAGYMEAIKYFEQQAEEIERLKKKNKELMDLLGEWEAYLEEHKKVIKRLKEQALAGGTELKKGTDANAKDNS